VQRLFSTFPEGWPGIGLLFLRAAAAIPILQHAGFATPLAGIIMLHVAAAVSAVLLLLGSWTPIVGLLMALVELCLAFSHGPDPAKHLLLGALGVALAMLGPGAWSIDARRFGRKRLQFPQR